MFSNAQLIPARAKVGDQIVKDLLGLTLLWKRQFTSAMKPVGGRPSSSTGYKCEEGHEDGATATARECGVMACFGGLGGC
jgi:hypothetical protein